MKLFSHRLSIALVLAAWLAAPRAGSAATLTVTPPSVGNTYGSAVTLDIAGLTNHEPVIVQTYLDRNTDGAVDAGDLLFDAFRMTESGVSTIGGITNISVPFDSNPATDGITTELSFATPLESTVGQKIYRVSSPFGRFAPAIATFNVTNAALGQAVAGTVFAGGAPQPGTVVVALGQPNFYFAGAALSDSGGNYYLTLVPGTYALLPAGPGYYTDQSLLPIVALTNGMTATNDLFLTSGNVTISGQVHDAVSSNGLGGVFLQFESGSLFGVGFTDTNGNYTGGVSSNNWSIRVDVSRLARRAYVTRKDSAAVVDATQGSVSNVALPLFKGNALFHGRFTDGFGTPFANVSIGVNDLGQQLQAEGFTDADGYYAAVALVDTNTFPGSDVWRTWPNNDTPALANYVVSQTADFPLTAHQAYLQNFSVLPVTGRISGRLQNNLGLPVSGVSVGAYAVIGGTVYNTAYVDTDANGDYSFGAADGQWFLNVNCCGDDGLENQGYYDPEMQHMLTIPPTNHVVNITVYPIGTPYLSQPAPQGPGQFSFVLSGAPGNNYTIQATTNLTSPNWFTVLVASNLAGNFYFIQDNQATNGQRYYRALLGP